MAYCIIKKMELKVGKPQHVILVNNHSEIQEWSDENEANEVAELFNANTDSGFEYSVKKI